MEAVAAALLAASAWQFAASSVQHSDALPLARWSADDSTAELLPRSGRNIAYLQQELRLSRGTEAWGRFGVLSRQSAVITASRGALELAAEAERGGRPAGSREWAVSGRYLGFAGSGLTWQHGFAPAPGWRLQGGVQALVLQRWRERRIDGDASYTAATDSYRFELQSFEASEKLDFPYRRPYAGRGQALLLEAGVAWTGERLALAAAVHDAGTLRWRGLPQNQSRLSTDTQSHDSDGFVVYQPLVQGQNSQPVARRAAPARGVFSARWQLAPNTTLEAGAMVLPHFGALPVLRAEHAVGAWRWRAAWHTHERRATLGLGWAGLQLELGADRLGSAARSRQAALSVNWPL